MSRIDVETVLEAFITMWVARFGVPARITTDRGTQFTSGTWGDWCQKQGVQHITTTAYHPQTNAQRYDGVDTPHVKGGSVCQRRGSRLEGPLTVGSARHAGCPERRN